jgi:hypothetical protein
VHVGLIHFDAGLDERVDIRRHGLVEARAVVADIGVAPVVDEQVHEVRQRRCGGERRGGRREGGGAQRERRHFGAERGRGPAARARERERERERERGGEGAAGAASVRARS